MLNGQPSALQFARDPIGKDWTRAFSSCFIGGAPKGDEAGECPVGSIDCPCTDAGFCDPGGVCEYFRVTAQHLAMDTHKLPDGISDEEAVTIVDESLARLQEQAPPPSSEAVFTTWLEQQEEPSLSLLQRIVAMVRALLWWR